MKTFPTEIRDETRRILSLIDYIVWLIFDSSKFKTINKKEIKKVLIIHLGSFGELMITTPLLPALKKELNCEISFMVTKGKEKVFENNPYVSEVFNPSLDYKGNIKNLKNKNYNLVVILYPASFKVCLMCFLSKIKYRIGCFPVIKSGPSFFLTRKIFPLRLYKKNAVQENLDMIRQIKIDSKNPRLEFYISDKEKNQIAKILKKLKIKDYAVVHPGSSFSTEFRHSSKIWPLERYAEVIDYLTAKYNFKIFLTGNHDEIIFSEKIKEKIKNKKNVIIANDLLDIRSLAALISKAKLFISAPTGIIHIAAAFGTPSIFLFGQGNYVEWKPWSKNCKTLFHPEKCTECKNNYCRKKNIECMMAITSQEVINAADELMEKK